MQQVDFHAIIALDSFLLCAAIAFVSASVSAIKLSARSPPNPQAALDECSGNGICFIAGTLVRLQKDRIYPSWRYSPTKR